jgi:hypothetical protein
MLLVAGYNAYEGLSGSALASATRRVVTVSTDLRLQAGAHVECPSASAVLSLASYDGVNGYWASCRGAGVRYTNGYADSTVALNVSAAGGLAFGGYGGASLFASGVADARGVASAGVFRIGDPGAGPGRLSLSGQSVSLLAQAAALPANLSALAAAAAAMPGAEAAEAAAIAASAAPGGMVVEPVRETLSGGSRVTYSRYWVCDTRPVGLGGGLHVYEPADPRNTSLLVYYAPYACYTTSRYVRVRSHVFGAYPLGCSQVLGRLQASHLQLFALAVPAAAGEPSLVMQLNASSRLARVALRSPPGRVFRSIAFPPCSWEQLPLGAPPCPQRPTSEDLWGVPDVDPAADATTGGSGGDAGGLPGEWLPSDGSIGPLADPAATWPAGWGEGGSGSGNGGDSQSADMGGSGGLGPSISPSLAPSSSPADAPAVASASDSASSSVSAAASASVAASAAASGSAAPSLDVVMPPTASASASPSRELSHSPSVSLTASPTRSNASSPSRSPSASVSPSVHATYSGTRTPSRSATASLSFGASRPPSVAPVKSGSNTPSVAPSRYPSQSPLARSAVLTIAKGTLHMDISVPATTATTSTNASADGTDSGGSGGNSSVPATQLFSAAYAAPTPAPRWAKKLAQARIQCKIRQRLAALAGVPTNGVTISALLEWRRGTPSAVLATPYLIRFLPAADAYGCPAASPAAATPSRTPAASPSAVQAAQFAQGPAAAVSAAQAGLRGRQLAWPQHESADATLRALQAAASPVAAAAVAATLTTEEPLTVDAAITLYGASASSAATGGVSIVYELRSVSPATADAMAQEAALTASVSRLQSALEAFAGSGVTVGGASPSPAAVGDVAPAPTVVGSEEHDIESVSEIMLTVADEVGLPASSVALTASAPNVHTAVVVQTAGGDASPLPGAGPAAGAGPANDAAGVHAGGIVGAVLGGFAIATALVATYRLVRTRRQQRPRGGGGGGGGGFRGGSPMRPAFEGRPGKGMMHEAPESRANPALWAAGGGAFGRQQRVLAAPAALTTFGSADIFSMDVQTLQAAAAGTGLGDGPQAPCGAAGAGAEDAQKRARRAQQHLRTGTPSPRDTGAGTWNAANKASLSVFKPPKSPAAFVPQAVRHPRRSSVGMSAVAAPGAAAAAAGAAGGDAVWRPSGGEIATPRSRALSGSGRPASPSSLPGSPPRGPRALAGAPTHRA